MLYYDSIVVFRKGSIDSTIPQFFIFSFIHTFFVHPIIFQALGVAGAADAVVGALQRHGVSGEVNRVMEMASDAIRSLCCLER